MPEDFQPVKSAGRTLDLLELLADQPHAWALGDLARALGIPKSSLHGLLRTLTGRGWVRTDDTGTRFRLGMRALRVGAAYLDGDDSVSLLAGVLDELSREFGEAVHLGRLDGDQVVYLAKRESVHRLRLYSAVGRRLPAHATALGKALLAGHPDAEVDRLLTWPLPRLTPHTITDRRPLHAALAAVRASGHAVDREENAEGIVCFAVAVPLATPAVDAVSVSVPVTRLRPELETSIVASLRRTVGDLTRARGMLTA
ncbi:IclR family transcriptional regulator [Micromonospora endolithica]|uniref:Glycerol operon regulatory protein n=1 Tax=Micromonospora endolithica TaxID=230091 RepID=A0A3A9ZB93_9ACTN|nr:IclR family transcriptional regulator [Micromonospora endolithica]RKN45389.1 IclR family transcriptional regulator [Micromonospora endolithica]TWJ22901.1 IclR family transcriptional regulator [Micromonospora endolithica]